MTLARALELEAWRDVRIDKSAGKDSHQGGLTDQSGGHVQLRATQTWT